VEPPATPAAARPTPEDAHAYRLPVTIDPMTLRRYFTLHGADHEEVGRCRGAANTLGFAVQLCTLRWRGHFGLVVTSLPKVAIWKACSFNGLRFTQCNRGRFPGSQAVITA